MCLPIHQNHLRWYCRWNILGSDDFIWRSSVLSLWLDLWVPELHHRMVRHTIRPSLAYSMWARGESLVVLCEVLLRSLFRVLRKVFLKREHKL